MSAPPSRRLSDLPAPPPGKSGWPWTVETQPLPAHAPDGSAWPRISIVTPSFNQGRYLEETLRSVLLQGYPDLEYVVIDGGSTDNSAQILEKYRPFLDACIRETTQGHADALNRAMQRTTGAILAFINSDDFYLPGAFAAITQEFLATKSADLIYGACLFVDQTGREFIRHLGRISSLDDALDFPRFWRADREIVQPEAFWRRSVLEKTGAFNVNLGASFWYEYVCRMLIAGASFCRLDQPLACFRFHPAQRSQIETDRSFDDYLTLAETWLWDRSLPISPALRRRLQNEWVFERKYKPWIATSTQNGASRLQQWVGTAKICLRNPPFFFTLPAVRRALNRKTPPASPTKKPAAP